MNNFVFHNPTELIFGKGMIKELSKRIPQDRRILLTFGGGSVKSNGVYDAVIKELEGYDLVEFWGIEPNPKVQTLRKAIALGKEKQVGYILAVGGGSVLDASKLIACAICSDLDAWELVLEGYNRSGKSLPLGTVLTIPATGSEMNRGAVISDQDTQEKKPFYGSFPIFSILDPTYTYSLPAYQVACGIADTYIHTVEQYLTQPAQNPLIDRWAEAILLTLIEQAPELIKSEADYDSRANFMLCATMALNGIIGMGAIQDWATHLIGHELTALTGLTHGHTLAIIYPGLLRVVGHTYKREKMLQYAERIWGISTGSEEERIAQAIEKTERFFRSLGLETRLAERKIGTDITSAIVQRFKDSDTHLGETQAIDYSMVAEILASC